MILLKYGAWVGLAWVVLLVIGAIVASRPRGRSKEDDDLASMRPHRRRLRRVVYVALALLLGFGSLYMVGERGAQSVRDARAANLEHPTSYIDYSESLLIRLAACSSFHRTDLFYNLRLYSLSFPMTERIVRHRIAIAAANSCIGARRIADAHGVPAPELGDCGGQLAVDERIECQRSVSMTDQYDDLMVDGDIRGAIEAARAASREATAPESAQMWECLALGLEARESGDLSALREMDDPVCRLILATLVPLDERAALLLDLSALPLDQRTLGLILLAEASPLDAAAQLNDSDVSQLAGYPESYKPGIAKALESVEGAEESTPILLLRATLLTAHGINAITLVQLDEAESRFRSAEDALSIIERGIEVEYERLLATWGIEGMSREGLQAFRATRFELDAQLVRGVLQRNMTRSFRDSLTRWHAVIQVLRGHREEAMEFLLEHDVEPNYSHRWLRSPDELLRGTSEGLRSALETHDGERMAIAMADDLADHDERLEAAFMATTHQDVLAEHLRYRWTLPSCLRSDEWRVRRYDRFLAEILHADAWAESLQPRLQELAANFEDVLLHVPGTRW